MPSRCGNAEIVREGLRLVVDARIEARLLDTPGALVRPTRDADHACAMDLPQLPDDLPYRATGGAHHNRLCRLHLGDIEQTLVCGVTGHAEHTERQWMRGPASHPTSG